jgi:hypothetical protein
MPADCTSTFFDESRFRITSRRRPARREVVGGSWLIDWPGDRTMSCLADIGAVQEYLLDA